MLNNAINAKPEFRRRFYLYDMDYLALANLWAKQAHAHLTHYPPHFEDRSIYLLINSHHAPNCAILSC
ncbi:hypothetical protein BpHYR1_026689 [Brachionus plicatilis]|uniref:Uncharacterized protein n=1 Tax=Brachionus plicatilis TaxID=10195 RepID=A0A3M7RUD4_BRAPC|nr:hypothetical protein BpHYR1_026689 [Brachionus plicatilis]